ncbi:hypothetical protein ACQ4LE_006119 [Meloidogyne hapla]
MQIRDKEKESRINVINNSNNQQKVPKIVQTIHDYGSRIRHLETKVKELTDKTSDQTVAMQIQEIQTNHKKEIETLKDEFVVLEKKLEEKINNNQQPKIGEINNIVMDTAKIAKLETIINELNVKISNQAIESFKAMEIQIEKIQTDHKKEIETLKKEFQEKMEKEISDLNSKFSVLLTETSKKNEEENKLNNEKSVGVVDAFHSFRSNNTNPNEEVKLEKYVFTKEICDSIDRVNNWFENKIHSEPVNDQNIMGNDFELLDNENEKNNNPLKRKILKINNEF